MYSFYKGKRILITGGAGFIGSNLAIRFIPLGARVTIVDAFIPGYGGNLFNLEPVRKNIRLKRADMRDTKKIEPLLKHQDIIFNLAGTLSHVDSMTDPMTDLEINCRSQLALLESVRKINPEARIIFAGTRNQYGKAQQLPVTELHPQEPTDINGINNIAAEKYHLMYTSVYGIPTVSLRMTNTFGPRHQMRHSRQGVLNWFVRQILDGEEVVLFGDGTQVRDVNYIDDIIEALLLVAANEKGWGDAYNLGGSPISLLDFVNEIIDVVGTGKIRIKPFPKDREVIEVGNYIAAIDKIHATYGWKPKTSLREGIEKTVEYYRKHKKHYW